MTRLYADSSDEEIARPWNSSKDRRKRQRQMTIKAESRQRKALRRRAREEGKDEDFYLTEEQKSKRISQPPRVTLEILQSDGLEETVDSAAASSTSRPANEQLESGESAAPKDAVTDSDLVPSRAAREHRVCKFWKQGRCKKGESCRFRHPRVAKAPSPQRHRDRDVDSASE